MLLIALGACSPAWSYLRSGDWAPHLPTTALLAMRSVLGGWEHVQVRYTLLDRFRPVYDNIGVRQGVPTQPLWQQHWAIILYISDLRDDNVRCNAEEAADALDWFAPELTINPLQRALNAKDYQQRQYAAHLLRRMNGAPATDDLLRVSVEALGDDPPDPHCSWMSMCNARSAFDYLLKHGDAAAPHLKVALQRGDAQQQFLAALLAAATRQNDLLPAACPMLVESLGSDNIAENAKYAAAALVRLGPPALPYLEPAWRDSDDQRRQVAVLLTEGIREPRGPATKILESDAAAITQEVLEPSLLRLESLEHHFYDFPSIRRASNAIPR